MNLSPTEQKQEPFSNLSGSNSDNSQDKKEKESFFQQAPSISLPKGGGAIKSIDEKFSVNAVNGTGSLNIPLPVSKIRQSIAPPLSLSYNSGSGNSEFGLGWSMQIPSISRKTDKGIPRYFDATESDTFLYSGAEDLVPLLEQNGNDWVAVSSPRLSDGIPYTIYAYRPRIEGNFARIERWVNKANLDTHWRTTSRENILSVYGIDAASRIADPQDPLKIFKWLLSYSCDDKGNLSIYQYKPEDFAGVGAALYEKNKKGHCTNTYLKQVLYGNKTPFYRGDAMPAESDFMMRILLDYGEYNPAGMGFYTNINHDIPGDIHVPKNDWAWRKDSFSNCRSGFEIRNYRRCQRVMLFHCFEELRATATPCLVQSMELIYDEQVLLENPAESIAGFSYLVKIIHKGHKLNAAGTAYDSRALPALEFKYSQIAWETSIQEIDGGNIEHVPSPADGTAYQWTDLYSEGISGILLEQGPGWYYKYNLGGGKLSAPELVANKPSFTGLSSGKMSIREIAGNGKKYAVGFSGDQQGFFGLSEDDTWEPFTPFRQIPNLDYRDSNLKWIDLDGDGMADLIVSEEDIFFWYPAKGEQGFDIAAYARKAKDEERGPAIIFADEVQSVFLADMTGDGLTDIVRIRNGEVSYWANMGYGRFSAKVSMENAPKFDYPDNYNPAFLRLADIDGSGTTDIVYLGKKDFRVWFNLNGNAWREKPSIINPFPDVHNLMDLSVFDLLGTGTSCIVWASPLPADREHPLRFIDFSNGIKPHLLTGYVNNLGKEVTLTYQSSTSFYLADKKNGNHWVTKLPFPVQVVSKSETFDAISKALLSTEYSYHHGYYDQVEREFRGFGRVDQTDTEIFTDFARDNGGNITDKTLHQAPVLTRSWFHTGAFLRNSQILNQFSREYFQNDSFEEHPLPDAYIELPAGMKPEDLPSPDLLEAYRACKGRMLRREIFARDGTDFAEIPYTVEQQNSYIKMLQPRGKNNYASFIAATSETITYNYERISSDPRTKHECNLAIDQYNNVVSAVVISYPRMINNPKIPTALQQEIQNLPAAVTTAQAAMHIILSTHEFTNDLISDIDYRLCVNAATQNWELTGAKGAKFYFSAEELKKFAGQAGPLAYSDPVDTTKVQKRILLHERTIYAADDAGTALPLLQLASKGIKYETYGLAYTEKMLDDIFSGNVDTGLLGSGGYRSSVSMGPLFPNSDPPDDCWIPSGRSGYPANAVTHFFLPDKFIDPFGKITLAAMDTKYHLYIPMQQDPVSNQVNVLSFDFRVMQPTSVKDANDNISEVRCDILGLVVGTAQKGKGAEADDFTGFSEDPDEAAINNFFNDPLAQGPGLLQHATSRVLYDLHHLPTSAATIQRERHFRDVQQNGGPDQLQFSFEYSGGLGQVLMKKIEATPGIARFIDGSGHLQSADTSPDPRWIGNGRKVLNNKGNAVKQYQPYFGTTHRYEDDSRLVEVGPTNLLFYDPPGRVIMTILPNESFAKSILGGWKRADYDFNDTVTDSPWYTKRFNRQIDAQLIADGKDPVLEQAAATKASKHAGTPFITHLDTLAGAVCKVANNKDNAGNDIFCETFFNPDVKGNILSVTDAAGHSVIEYRYDIANNPVSELSPESGTKTSFFDVMNHPLRQWDSRKQIFIFTYDDLRRPLTTTVTGGDGDKPLNHLVGKTIYGEGQPADKQHNLRTRPFTIFDQSGITIRTDFDFNGSPLGMTRQFCADYDKTINWNDTIKMEDEIWLSSMTYDALKRVTTAIAPHLAAKPVSGYYPSYNESGLLGAMDVSIRGGARTSYVIKVNYNEKGLRTDIQYGNNTKTFYTYDKQTFRLLGLRTTRPAIPGGFSNNLFKDGTILQNLLHTYDPMGNITNVKDDALATVSFDGEQVNPVNDYEYDALYQLITATGRKQAGQNEIQHTRSDFNYRNQPFINSTTINPADISAFRNYQEIFSYDKVGNMLEQQHVSKNSSWTRIFEYGNGNNQLTKTTVGAFSTTYGYDPHGNLKMMEHLSSMHWEFSDALQMLDLGGGGKAYYNYDGEGKRTRKIIVRQDGTMKQRYYIGGIEIYREKDNAGQTTLERETLQLMDDKERIAMADTETTSGAAGTALVRYQAGNHLLSACLELDDAAKLISFEEYFPFGTSSFSSADGSREIPAKRYRYTGKERDEESGLNYHGARYYAPWICRWTAADKLQKKALENRYRYVKNNPVIYNDNNGAFEEPTHGAATYYLALAAGFSVDEATQIALATAGMDHDPATEPGLDEKTKDNHFPSFAQAIKNVDTEIAKLPAPGQLKPGQKPDLSEFGKKLHSLEDVGFVDAPGPHRRGGREPGLSESLRNAGLAIGGTGLAFAGIGALGFFLGPHMGDRIAGVVALVFGAILALIGLAAIIVSTLHVSQGIGHPIYCTKRGNLSTGLVHYADEAYQDPKDNREELRKIYGKLKEGAAKLHGSKVKSDDIIAEALIGVEGGDLGVVNADSPKKIQDYLDMLSQDNYGQDAPSYAQIVRKNCQSRVTGISVGWRDVDIDITVENSEVHYKSTVIMGKCN